jgi:hypothetical protein
MRENFNPHPCPLPKGEEKIVDLDFCPPTTLRGAVAEDLCGLIFEEGPNNDIEE